MIPSIAPIYAALLTFVYVVLCWYVIAYRRANMISLGDTGDKALLKRMRAQANFAEYAPLGIVLIVLVELTGAPGIAVHILGLTLLTGRIMHAVGFTSTPQRMILRQLGMLLTFLTLNVGALGLLLHALL